MKQRITRVQTVNAQDMEFSVGDPKVASPEGYEAGEWELTHVTSTDNNAHGGAVFIIWTFERDLTEVKTTKTSTKKEETVSE